MPKGGFDEMFECRAALPDGMKGDAMLTCAEGDLVIELASGAKASLAPRQVASLEEGQVNINLVTAHGDYWLDMFGRRFDRAAELISAWYKTGKLKDGLLTEEPEEEFTGITYSMPGRQERKGTFRLYTTHAAITDEADGRVRRFPYSYVETAGSIGLDVDIRMEKGDGIMLSMLGRRKDFLERRLEGLKDALIVYSGSIAGGIAGDNEGMGRAELGRVLPDGRAKVVESLAEKLPSLAGKLRSAALASKTGALVEGADELAIGVKKGVMGELDGDFCFVLARLGDAVIWDSFAVPAESKQQAKATYVFNAKGRSFAGFVEDICWSFSMTGFRREPVYLPEAKLAEPENAHFRQAVEDVPELKELRLLYKGRAAHSADGSWLGRIMKLAGR